MCSHSITAPSNEQIISDRPTFCRATATSRGNILATMEPAPGVVGLVVANDPDLPGMEIAVSDLRAIANMLLETADAIEKRERPR